MIPTLLLGSNIDVRERWQNRFRYLLVDEYQDTNTSQYQLVKLLVGQRARLLLWYDDQSISVAWRKATKFNVITTRFLD